jgi:hypothetical protein
MRKPRQAKVAYTAPAVPQAFVQSGVCEDPFNCAIAQHLINMDKNIVLAEVQKSRTTLTYGDGTAVDYTTPLPVQRCIDHFDKTFKKTGRKEWILPANEPITFGPIPKSQTRDFLRKRAARIRKAIAKGFRPAPQTYKKGEGPRGPIVKSVRQAVVGRRRASLAQLQSGL